MRKLSLVVMAVLLLNTTLCFAGFLDELKKNFGITLTEEKLSDDTIVSGLKEALSVATDNAVETVSRTNGYFGNMDIRILLPDNIRKVGEVLRKVGYGKQVDNFILSMNRAAEKAAPGAVDIFVDAVKAMTFEDARKILNGGDTAATDYFKSKTSDRLYGAFRPIVSASVDEVGVTRSYKEMMGQYMSLPFVDKESVDLDHYVTTKALEGLFYMVSQEERKIRTDPAARVTELLRKVFGR